MKIIGVGRNYAAHARELGNKRPTHPVLFLMPATALLQSNQPFEYPEFSQNIHFEAELVLRIGREGRHINVRQAAAYIDGIGLGIDFTARDLQQKAKEQGHPWSIAKGFDHSAPVSEMLPLQDIPALHELSFALYINGEKRQQGYTRDMIFGFEEVIAYASKFFTLQQGDLIFTGTPEGVGPVHKGDHLEGYMGERKMLDFEIT